MTGLQLTCNLTNCNQKLQNEAYITVCSHIFCMEHFPNINGQGSIKNCLACNAQLCNESDIMCINLNPSERYKTMILCGLSPEQIMEIVSHAMSFYHYQLTYDSHTKDNIIRNYKEQIEDLKYYSKSLFKKYKENIEKQQRMIERAVVNVKDELEEQKRANEKQKLKIIEYKRSILNLMSELETYKREINHYQTLSNRQSSPCNGFILPNTYFPSFN